jgi:hypothetical protein
MDALGKMNDQRSVRHSLIFTYTPLWGKVIDGNGIRIRPKFRKLT